MKPTLRRLSRKAVSATAAATMAAVGGIVFVQTAQASTQAVTKYSVNFRTGAGTGYSVIALLPAGTNLTVTGSPVGSWTPVTYNGRTGYVWSDYITVTQTVSTTPGRGTATVTSDVNVRRGPSTSYSIIDVASQGETVTVTGASGGWTQVDWNGQTGYIYSSYLTMNGGSSAPSSSTVSVAGQLRTLYNVNLRTSGSLSGSIYTQVPANTVMDYTGATTDSFTQVIYNGHVLWAYTAYLTKISTSGPAIPLASTTDARAQIAVDYAKAQLGKAYVWGATGPDAFDCSGLTYMAYKTAGISIPRVSRDQATFGRAVSRSELQPGDLIFWSDPVNHVSMYIGNGQMIHARNPTTGVTQQSVDSYINAGGYYVGARRVTG